MAEHCYQYIFVKMRCQKENIGVSTKDMVICIFQWFGEDRKYMVVVLVPPMKRVCPFLLPRS